MFLTLLRVMLGFLVACLVAGLVKVCFVLPPNEILALPESVRNARLADAGILSLAAATQSAMFAAPFALVAAAIGEWQALRSAFYYAFVGFAISGGGFVALFASELEGQPTIVNPYAASAYAISGIVAGLVYWLLAGRYSGDPLPNEEPAPSSLAPPGRPNRPAAAVPPVRVVPSGPTSSTSQASPQRRLQ